jgi:DNA polymerase III gamma/tau subunit
MDQANAQAELTIEELQQKLQESENQRLAAERAKIGLQADLVKRKNIERLAKAAGIDLSGEDADDRIAELLSAAKGERAPSAQPPAAQQQPPAQAQPQGQQDSGGSPSSAVEEAMKVQLSTLQTQLSKMEEQLKQERKEKEAERRARQQEYVKSVVIQELDKAKCNRSSHVFALRGGEFRLLEDGVTVVFGPEENPINVADGIAQIEQDEDYSIYFPGNVPSGSGLPSYRSSMPTTDNPFAKSTANATRAAEIIGRDRALAKRLVQQARARGDLDPILARAVS